MFCFSKNNSFTLMLYDLDTLTQLNEMQLKLLLILAARAEPSRGYTCFPTQEELSRISGWSRPTVQNVVNSLVDLKIDGRKIVTANKVVKQGGGYYTVYSVNCF